MLMTAISPTQQGVIDIAAQTALERDHDARRSRKQAETNGYNKTRLIFIW